MPNTEWFYLGYSDFYAIDSSTKKIDKDQFVGAMHFFVRKTDFSDRRIDFHPSTAEERMKNSKPYQTDTIAWLNGSGLEKVVTTHSDWLNRYIATGKTGEEGKTSGSKAAKLNEYDIIAKLSEGKP